MKKVLPRKRTLRILTILGALILFLGIGYAGARHIAWPWYKAWREDRANNIARDLLAKGDYPNALVAIRKTLGYNQFNTEAWKLAVEITEKQNSSQVVYYQQRLASVQPTLENKLKFLRLAVKYHAYKYALDHLEKMGPGSDVTKSPEFYELAATIAQRTNNPGKAKYFLISLVSLQPENRKARLDLAQLRIMDGFEENKPAVRSEIQELAADPALRVRALSILLADALGTQDRTAALSLTNQLLLTPSLPSATQLLVAETYHAYAPEQEAAYVAELKKNAGATREKIVPITTFLATHGQAAEVRSWIDTLSDELRADEAIQVSYAFSLYALKDNTALETYLRSLKWSDNEYVRQMFLAYVYRSRADMRAFADAWKLALIEAGNAPRKIQFLLTQTTNWKWPDQKYEVLWKKLSLDPSDKTTRNQIAAWEYSRGNTVNLNRLFARIAEYDPSDRDARNNYNYTSLILNMNLDRATRDTEELYKADPANAYYATTHALSLYKQNKIQDALRVIDTLGAAAQIVPERSLIRSVILIANGRIEDGLDQMTYVKLDRVLPEERRLYNETATIVAKSRRDQATIARLANLASAPASATGAAPDAAIERKSWLAPLPAAIREKATVQMELADSLYSSDDYKNLAETLRADRWTPENEYLRHALLAYAQRNLQRALASRDTWRLALSTAGIRPENLAVLEDLCERWGWTIERVEIQNRLVQRDPYNEKSFNDLAEYYTKFGQTSELARIFSLRVEAGANDAETKIRFAYYSLLTDTNLARAHVVAKESYDAAPKNAAAAKVYAFSLLKQSRAADGWRIISAMPDRSETGYAQLSLLKAVLAARQNDMRQAREQLSSFDSKSALPEEIALAETLNKNLAMATNT